MKRRVNLLNEVREAVGVKNTWTFDGRIHAMYKGKKYNIKLKEDLGKILSGLVSLIVTVFFFLFRLMM